MVYIATVREPLHLHTISKCLQHSKFYSIEPMTPGNPSKGVLLVQFSNPPQQVRNMAGTRLIFFLKHSEESV